jgi:hypothetical protein
MRLTPEEFGILKTSGDTVAAKIAEMRIQRQTILRLREREAILQRVTA